MRTRFDSEDTCYGAARFPVTVQPTSLKPYRKSEARRLQKFIDKLGEKKVTMMLIMV